MRTKEQRKLKVHKDKEKKHYDCQWCGAKFIQFVRRLEWAGTFRDAGMSDQVICPYCSNFVPTGLK